MDAGADMPQPATADVPLCVDLDGTLVKSDTLLDAVLVLARQHPGALLRIPGWIASGKAHFKQQVTALAPLDVERLPYNRPLLEWLRQQAGMGRALYLATAADRSLAERVAAHLGIFRGVLASDGTLNLAGNRKLQAFRDRFGERFSYIGNAAPDAVLLQACETPMLANPTRALRGQLRSATQALPVFTDRAPLLKSWLRAVRLHQWAKNALLFVPLLLGHAWYRANMLLALLAFVSFGLCASGTYILNDLLDIEADRKHPRKARRPFAAGDLSPLAGMAAVVVLVAAAFGLALSLPRFAAGVGGGSGLLPEPWGFVKWLAIYTATTLIYSLYLKRKLLLDVFVLSGLYTVRILAGSAATGVPVSTWLAGFSVFFFLSLAFVKRFSELESLRERGGVGLGRGYVVGDLEQLRTLGTGAAYAAVVVVTLYINSPEVLPLYTHHRRLWLLVPVVLLWLSQVWVIAGRGEMHDDPVVWAITNKRSLLLGVVIAAVVWSAL